MSSQRIIHFVFFAALIVICPLIYIGGLIDPMLTSRFTFVSAFLLLFCLINWGCLRSISTNKVQNIDLLLLGYYFVNLLSISWAPNVAEALFESQKLSLFVLCYFSTKLLLFGSSGAIIQTITKCMLIISVIVLPVALLHLYNLHLTENLDRHATVIITGLSGNRNLFAGFVLLLIPFNIYGAFTAKSLWRYGYATVLLLQLGLLYAMETRSAYVGLFILAIALLYFVAGTFLHVSKRIWFSVFFYGILLVFLGILILFISGNILGVLDTFSFIKKGTTTGTWHERILIWGKTMELFSENSLLGVGSGNWKFTFPLTGVEGIARAETNSVFFARAHNDWIEILAETGLIGFLLYVAFWIGILKSSCRAFIRSLNKKPLIIIAIFTSGILAYGAFASISFPKERIEHLLILAIYFAILSFLLKDHIKTIKTPPLLQKSAWVIVVLVMGFNTYLGVSRMQHERSASAMTKAYHAEDYSALKNRAANSGHWSYTVTPVGTPIRFYTGVAALYTNNIEEAIYSLEKAKIVNPGFLATYTNLGVAYFQKGDLKNAEKNYLQALDISNAHTDTNYNLALLYLHTGDIQKSLPYIQQLPDSDSRKKELRTRIVEYNE